MVSVSVIIPAYNASDTLLRILGFLREQAFNDMELILVVDDRSTDGSQEYARGLSENVEGFRIVLQTGPGRLGEARNIGLDAAGGKYIWFLDADDRPYPDFLHTMFSLAEEHDSEIVQCNFIRSSDPETKEPDVKCSPLVATGKEALIERAHERVPVTAWSMLIRRDFLLENGLRFPEGGYAEDVDFIYRAFEKCRRYCYYNRPMYLYLENENSICFSEQNERGRGEIYRDGKRVEKNAPEALKWFMSAAEQGNMHSALAIIRMHDAKQADEESFEYAFKRIEQLADGGNVTAIRTLGTMYLEGKSVTKDMEKAKEWFRKSTTLGDVFSHNKLKALEENKV